MNLEYNKTLTKSFAFSYCELRRPIFDWLKLLWQSKNMIRTSFLKTEHFRLQYVLHTWSTEKKEGSKPTTTTRLMETKICTWCLVKNKTKIKGIYQPLSNFTFIIMELVMQLDLYRVSTDARLVSVNPRVESHQAPDYVSEKTLIKLLTQQCFRITT